MTAAHVDVDTERAVLGGLILQGTPERIISVAANGLHHDHFHIEAHQAIWRALLSLADRNRAVDPITVVDELDRLGLVGDLSADDIGTLTAFTPAIGNVTAHAERVTRLAEWRAREKMMAQLTQAVGKRDDQQWSKLLTDLDRDTYGSRTETYGPQEWADLLFDWYSGTGVHPDAIPTPFLKLTDALAGGLWPGELMIIGGPTSHGKTVIADMWADYAAARNIQTHIYMTEMTALGRGMRYVSRQTGIPFMRQRKRDLTADELKRIVKVLGDLEYGISIVADWDPDDVVRDAIRARHRFVIVDLIHGWHYSDERELDRISKSMLRLAKTSTTIDGFPGCSVIAVAHIKEEGMKDGRVPMPTVSSLKGASSLKQDSDFVMFVHQDQKEGGAPTGEGRMYMPKGRGGEPFHLDLKMNRQRFIFEPKDGAEQQTSLNVATTSGDPIPF